MSKPNRRQFLSGASGAALAGSAGVYALAHWDPAAASPASPGNGYPRFTWDHVPQGAQIGKLTGDFSPSEASFIGQHWAFIALAQTGMPDNPPGQKFLEVAYNRNAHLLKSANPQLKVLVYWGWQGLIRAYQAYTRPDYDETWRVPKGRRLLHDVTNPAFRQWWATAAADIVNHDDIDGMFVDGIDNDKYDPSFAALIQGLRQKFDALDKPKLILLNGRQGPLPGDPHSFFNFSDGEMIEQFGAFANVTPDRMQRLMINMASLAKAGKIVLFKTWPGFTFMDPTTKTMGYQDKVALARRNITFPLACFLVAAQPYCYFQYGWGYNNDAGAYILQDATVRPANQQQVDPTYYPELLKPLGAPLGDPAINGYEWTRSFQHAAVRVNLGTRQAAINWA